MKQAMIDFMQKIKNDNLYTPEYAIYPLLKYIENKFNKNIKIWECTDFGNSQITKVLLENNYKNVIKTDIVNGFDFLSDKPDFDFDIIITNPPYSFKDSFIEKCYEYGKPWALLLPLTALEGIKRGNLFREYGISLLVFDRRIEFTGKGANWFATAWFCWNILENNKIIFESLNKK